MQTNALPLYDINDNPTRCCPHFKPEGWDEQELHFDNKLFLKAKTRSLFHIPINMGSVFRKIMPLIDKANAGDPEHVIGLSYDVSPWTTEHYLSVQQEVPGQENVHLTGNFLTKVYEGPYKNAPRWQKEMEQWVRSQGKTVDKTYFFYTTCPKCAKYYKKNYVVAVSQVH